jgi:peroxiredoxin
MSAIAPLRRTTQELVTRYTAFRDSLPPAKQKLFAQWVEALTASNLAQSALTIGDPAPDFILPSANGQPTRLYSLLQRGPVVLVFYRGGWCPFCATYLTGLQRELFYLREFDAELVAISPQLPDASLQFETDRELTFPVLSDVGLKTARLFGLVYDLPSNLLRTYREFGIDLTAYNGTTHGTQLPLAATYVIGPDRKILRAAIDEDPARRLDPIDILETLARLRPGFACPPTPPTKTSK